MSLKEIFRVSINFYSPAHLSVSIDQLQTILMHGTAPWLQTNGNKHFILQHFHLIRKRQALLWKLASKRITTEAFQLPPNLTAWQNPEEYDGLYLKLWSNFEDFFHQHGFILWCQWCPISITLCPPEDSPDGFMHSAPCRVEDSLQSLGYFPQKVHPPFLPLPNNDIHSHQNGLSCPARSRDGNDVIIQIITAGGQGDKDLKILKRLAADVESLQSDNHVLPMLEEFV